MAEKRFYVSSEAYTTETKTELSISFSENYQDFENKYNTFYEGVFEEGEHYIPLAVFSSEMGSFQAIVKYLKEKQDFKYSKIAKLTNRDQRTIWNVYNKVKNVKIIKSEDASEVDANQGQKNLSLPLSIISDRKQSVLASIIFYLKDIGFSFAEIATQLERNYQTIYTTHRNATKTINIEGRSK